MPDEQPDPARQTRTKAVPGTVEFRQETPGIACVHVHGEHDLSTVPALAEAFEQAAAHANALVDLSECTFIDSSVIAVLLRAAQAATARGAMFVVVIPPEQERVTRVADLTGLVELLDVRASREAALRSIEHSVEASAPERPGT
jgi:anti-sigma B factor antagonist